MRYSEERENEIELNFAKRRRGEETKRGVKEGERERKRKRGPEHCKMV